MASPPYQKFFWGSYHKHTAHLGHAREHGAYLLLIGALWNNDGRLPADDATLAGYAKLTIKEWETIKPKLINGTLLRIVRGKLTQPRVSEDLAKYRDTSGKRKLAGKAGGTASAENKRENRQAIAGDLPTKPEPEPEPIEGSTDPSLRRGKPTRAREPKKAMTPIPDGFPDVPAQSVAEAMIANAGVRLDVASHVQRFRDHALSQDRRAADWLAAWRTWITKQIEDAPTALQPAPVQPLAWNGPKPIWEAVVARKSEGWAVSYLGRCTWQEAPVRAAVAPHSLVADALREVSDVLGAEGASIITKAEGMAA